MECLLTQKFREAFFILGGGGVGKSTIINVVTRHCNQVLNKVGDDPNQPKILLLAPTGMAACLIGKIEFRNQTKHTNSLSLASLM